MTTTTKPPHYVRQPGFLPFIRIAQIPLAFLILVLTAYSMSKLTILTTLTGSFGFTIFCCIYTFIVNAYWLVSENLFVNFWNMWVALILNVIGIPFWLSAWASLASWVASFHVLDEFLGGKEKAGWQCAAAAAGLGALIWILFIIHLITFALSLHRHRTAPENAHLPKDGTPVKEEKHMMGQVQGGMHQQQQQQEQQQQHDQPVYNA